MEPINQYNNLSERIIGAAIEVHRVLGPGLLESAYEKCLNLELVQKGIKVEIQKPLPIVYKGMSIKAGYRIDMLVENIIVIELKSLDVVLPVHKAQLLSYLRLGNFKMGLLINFNSKLLIMASTEL